MWNKDEVKGAAKQIKGKMEKTVGKASHDDKLEGQGVLDETSGKVQQHAGEARRNIGKAIEKVGKAIKR
jgi:uncharacterized protein YjbJ (UPF0337 family)